MTNYLYDVSGMLLTFFLIRILSFSAAFPNNFDNMWHLGGLNIFPQAVITVLLILAAYVLFCFTQKLGKAEDRTKTAFFAYIGISYIFLSLFTRTILNMPFSYLFLMQYMKMKFSIIIPNLVLDLFFEPPYSFWFLVLMGIIFFICKKLNHIEYAVPFWIIPFYFIECPANDAIVTMHYCGCLIALLGFKFSRNNSSIIIQCIQFFFYAGFAIYHNMVGNNQAPIANIELEIIALFFIPGLILTYKSIKSRNEAAIAATWLIQVLNGFFTMLPLLQLPTQYNLISMLATSSCLLFASNIAIPVAIIALISIVTDKIIAGTGKLVSRILFAGAIVFYLVDGILFYYSQMRPDYNTLKWTLTMNDIGKTTVATCAEYFTPANCIIIILCLALTFFSAFQSRKAIQKSNGLAISMLILIITAQFSSMLMTLSIKLPQVMRDPFHEMLRTLPVSEFLEKQMSLDEIRNGMQECMKPLQEYSENAAKPGNKTNVVLITLESLHWRYLNMFGNATQTFPLMSKLKDRMEIFPFMFSCYPESTCGDYALISGLVPYNLSFLMEKNNIIHKTLVNELKKAGYNTSMFSSESVNDGYLINVTRTLPFDHFFHYNSSDTEYRQYAWSWGYKEEFTSTKIIEYLKSKPADQPYFVWYRTVYPHAPYSVFDQNSLVFPKKPYEKDFVTDYKNALIYLDRVLAGLIAEIDELDRKNNQKTIIFMVGDHGEGLGEPDNYYQNGHGIHITPQLTAVTSILIKPTSEGLKVNKSVCSQVDVLPTIMNYLELEPAIKRFAQGNSLFRPVNAQRPVYLASMSDYALVENGYYFEFPGKENYNTKIYKLGLTNDFKPEFQQITSWDEKDIQAKLEKIRKFYKLQQQLLNKL